MKMIGRTLALASFYFLAADAVPSAWAGDIVALCIGNNAYLNPEDQLDTPVLDAQLMHKTLSAVPGVLPQDIVLLTDARRSQMSLALRQFRAKAAEAKLALIFYSGHGMEDMPTGFDRPETFLLPVDAQIQSVDDLPDTAIPLREVLNALEGSRGGARAVILDCCRNGAPGATKSLAGSTKNMGSLDENVKRALGSAVIPDGTLIAFATSPGRKAAAFLTDADENSPFTKFLTDQMSTQGGDLFSIVNAASRTTKQRTEMRQVPHVELRGDASLITDYVIPAAQTMAVATTSQPKLRPLSELLKPAKSSSPDSNRMSPTEQTTTPNESSGSVVENLMTFVRLKEIKAAEESGNERLIKLVKATKEEPFINGLDMKFVPLMRYTGNRKVFFSIWETRNQDFQTFADRQSGSIWKMLQLNIKQQDHPAASVSWDDATAFCKWLTEKERAEGRIGPQDRYRLPTDAEWSHAVGISEFEDAQASPAVKDGLLEGVYPWGAVFPPPTAVGNYADISAKEKGTADEVIEGYTDGFAITAPVGSFAPNKHGLYDMGGNVCEWCEDWFDDKQETRVLRGGSWYDMAALFIRSSSRFHAPPGDNIDFNGFRCVLEISTLP